MDEDAALGSCDEAAHVVYCLARLVIGVAQTSGQIEEGREQCDHTPAIASG
jgi:hypothetical protein